MAGLQNNLYPPIIETYMPAFLNTEACRIYFSLSRYNVYDEIKKNVQVSVNNQNTNLSMLSTSKYPTGIMITSVYEDTSIGGDNRYYIIVSPSDLEDGIFEINQYYKVQIRFTAASVADPQLGENGEQQIANWLVNNQDYFSEWSTVCLIKGISQPVLDLRGFDNTTADSSMFSSSTIDLIGKLYFLDRTEKEYLKSYRVQIYNEESSELVFDSQDIYPDEYSINEINYTIAAHLKEGVQYYMDFMYVTNNLYMGNEEFNFIIIQIGVDEINAELKAEMDKETASSVITVDFIGSFVGNLTIRRTSSESDFLIWEDVHIAPITTEKSLSYVWHDYTIKSGVWYKYSIQNRNIYGDRGPSINQAGKPIMVIFDDIFLEGGGKQLKIKFNPQVSSFKHTIVESKVDTIGSQYPFIRRNANVNYKQFSISGLITHWCDESKVFLTKDIIDLTKEYNQANRINDYNDFIQERDFREAVIKFLYDDSIKLFRSTTEGNTLVKLMDISFTPEKTLGRMIYSFNATAYEMDVANLANCDKYNVQSIGECSSDLTFVFTKIGKLDTWYGSNTEIMDSIRAAVASDSPNYINTVSYLSGVKITFNESYARWIDSNNRVSNTETDGAIYGFLIYINDEPIVVKLPNKVYELKGEGIYITSLRTGQFLDIELEYEAVVKQEVNRPAIIKKATYYNRVGQLYDTFDPQEDIIAIIKNQYNQSSESFYTQVLKVNITDIEAPDNTVFFNSRFDKVLTEDDTFGTLPKAYFQGIKMEGNPQLVGTFESIEAAIAAAQAGQMVEGSIYTIMNTDPAQAVTYYEEQVYYVKYLANSYVIVRPIKATIDYTYEMLKGEY